jgi:hypothetical protein
VTFCTYGNLRSAGLCITAYYRRYFNLPFFLKVWHDIILVISLVCVSTLVMTSGSIGIPISSFIVEDWFNGDVCSLEIFAHQSNRDTGLYTATMLGTLWVISTYFIFVQAYLQTEQFPAYSGHFEGMRKNYHMALIVLMYICSTMHSSLQWFFYSSAINKDEGTDGNQLIQALTHLAPWFEATGDVFFSLNIFIADCLFVS